MNQATFDALKSARTTMSDQRQEMDLSISRLEDRLRSLRSERDALDRQIAEIDADVIPAYASSSLKSCENGAAGAAS